MKQQLLLFLAGILLTGNVLAQSSDFKKIEDQITDKIGQGQWDEVLLLATDLLVEEPGRGEGYYYTSLAFFKQGHYDKASEYLAQATPLADSALNPKIAALSEDIRISKEGRQLLSSAEAQADGGNTASAAEDFRKVWELDKSNVNAALNAVELYLEKESYEEALSILNDPSLSQDPGARTLIDKINQTPHMQQVNGYNVAISQGEAHMELGNYGLAVSMYDKALSFKDSDPQATRLKREAEDELSWKGATQRHTIEAYEAYLSGNTDKKYYDQAMEEVRRGLYYNGEEAAELRDIPRMEFLLLKYLNNYAGGQYDESVKKTLCDAYLLNAAELAAEKDAYSQQRAVEFYNKSNQYCPDYDLDADIRTAEKKAKRYGRPDRGYLAYVYDSIAPIGISFGSINNRSLGMYMSLSANEDIFASTSIYKLEDGSLDGGNGVATGERTTGYADAVIGLTKKITYPLWLYAGGGVSYKMDLHEYEFDGELEWVENKDESGIDPLVDAGVIIDLSGFFIRGGLKTDLEEFRYTAGVGFSW